MTKHELTNLISDTLKLRENYKRVEKDTRPIEDALNNLFIDLIKYEDEEALNV